jgi:hypothetical protein
MIRHRTMLLVGSHALVLLLGVAAGVWLAVERVGRANAIFEDIGSLERMSSYVLAQQALGDSAAYESALNEYLSTLERRRATKGVLSDEKILATDIALAHTRLALLAEKRGDVNASKIHFDQALAQCGTASLKNCSADGLRQVVVALDSRAAGGSARSK